MNIVANSLYQVDDIVTVTKEQKEKITMDYVTSYRKVN